MRFIRDDIMKVIKRMALGILAATAISCSPGSSGIPYIPSDQGQGYVEFAENDATRILIETYGGTVHGAQWVSGMIGEALSFNGYDQYVSLPYHKDLDLTAEGTLEAYVYVNSHRPFAGLIHKGSLNDFSDESYTLQFWGTDGTLLISLVNAEGERQMLFSRKKLETGRWHHVAATWNADSINLYIDGESDASEADKVGGSAPCNTEVIIGAQLPELYSTEWGHLCLDGLLDEVRILPEALSAAEIRTRGARVASSPVNEQ